MNHLTPRITARVDQDTQVLLQQAAKLVGISSINAFVLNAAIEKANRILEQEQRLKLNTEESERFFALLDSPPVPNDALKTLMRSSRN